MERGFNEQMLGMATHYFVGGVILYVCGLYIQLNDWARIHIPNCFWWLICSLHNLYILFVQDEGQGVSLHAGGDHRQNSAHTVVYI